MQKVCTRAGDPRPRVEAATFQPVAPFVMRVMGSTTGESCLPAFRFAYDAVTRDDIIAPGWKWPSKGGETGRGTEAVREPRDGDRPARFHFRKTGLRALLAA